MARLIPYLIAFFGLAIGVGSGLALRPPADAMAEDAAQDDLVIVERPAGDRDPSVGNFVRMNNQFVVPVVEDGQIRSLVVLALSLEMTPGSSNTAHANGPRLRDAFLQVLFDHANAGGFSGTFTQASTLGALRQALLESSRRVLGTSVIDVLITDIMRQDQ